MTEEQDLEYEAYLDDLYAEAAFWEAERQRAYELGQAIGRTDKIMESIEPSEKTWMGPIPF